METRLSEAAEGTVKSRLNRYLREAPPPAVRSSGSTSGPQLFATEPAQEKKKPWLFLKVVLVWVFFSAKVV